MKAAWLEGTDAEDVSAVTTQVLESWGALVTEHTRTHVEFEGWDLDEEVDGDRGDRPPVNTGHRFSRGGVVTLVQPLGEKEVEVRVRVRARLPSRFFWITLWAGLAATLVAVVTNPPASVWVLLGLVFWGSFVVASLVYLGTLRPSWQAEERLLERIAGTAEVEEVETREERLRREAREEAAGEALRRQLKAKRKA